MADLNKYYLPSEDVNDEKATITEIFFKSGEKVVRGDLIYTFETTKATVEVKAEHDGFINYFINEGKVVEVGALVCEISKSKIITDKKSKSQLIENDKKILPTKKAIALAKKHRVEINDLGLEGIVKESDIINFLQKQNIKGSTSNTNLEQVKNIGSIKLEIPKIVIIGAGAQALDLVEIISELKSFKVVGFLDKSYPNNKSFLGLPIFGKDSLIPNLKKEGIENVIITFGWIKEIQRKINVTKLCIKEGLKFPCIIHPKAVIHPSATLLPGTIVLANTFIGSHVNLGYGVIVNNNAVVSHGTNVGAFSHICPGSVVASNVTIGYSCVLGMNTSIFYGVRISDNKVITNNSCVSKDY